MEQAIRNRDRRLVNVEQILPTLATKDDLREAIQEALTESKCHTDVRFESLPDDIRMVAEAVAAIPARFDQVNTRIDRLAHGTDVRFAGTDARLDRIDTRLDQMDARLDRMDERFDGMDERHEGLRNLAESTAKSLEDLTRRLEARNVI
jgi:archaellum component FlaC